MSQSARSIELRPAFVYDCDECGREVFVRGCVPELSDEDLEALRQEHGVEPWETGDFMMMPLEVECPHCHAKFSTERMGE